MTKSSRELFDRGVELLEACDVEFSVHPEEFLTENREANASLNARLGIAQRFFYAATVATDVEREERLKASPEVTEGSSGQL